MSQPDRGLLSQRLGDDEDEVGSPRVMMTSAAARAARGFTRSASRSVIGGHDVRELVKTRMLAGADGLPVVRADLHPAPVSVGMTDAPAADDGYRLGMRAVRGREPLHALDGVDVGRAMPEIYEGITRNEQGPS